MTTKTSAQASEAAENSTTALTVVEEIANEYPILATNTSDLLADLADILQGEDPSALKFDKINVPTGGGKHYSLPALGDEEPTEAQTFEGIIIASHKYRLYWAQAYTGDSSPPDCSSPDGLRGVGKFEYGSAENPSGMCATCPMSQWESAGNGSRGQACKLRTVVYMLLPGQQFPVELHLPPTSGGALTEYRMDLIKRNLKSQEVVTRVGLKQAGMGGGTGPKYSVATFKLAHAGLGDTEKARIRAYTEAMTPLITPKSATLVAVDADDPEAPKQDIQF